MTTIDNNGRLASGGGRLTTIDCVAQSLAVGPIFSAAALGLVLAGLSGGIGPFVILLTLVGVLGIGYTISELAKRFSGAGTVYEYIAHTLGKRWAVYSAGAYHVAVIVLAGPGIAIVGGITAKSFFADHLGLDLPWWVWAVVVAAIVFVINVVGVHVSVKAQLGIIVASVIPFLVLAVVIAAKGGVAGNTIDPFLPSKAAEGGSVFKGLLFAILMFVGFELAAALGEETAEPRKSIPRAVLSTILIVAAFYLITQYVGTIGSGGEAALPFDFAVLAEQYVGGWLKVLIELAILLDMLAVGIGFTAAGARGLFTLSRDGLLPAPLARLSGNEAPAVAQGFILVVSLVGVFAALAKYGARGVVLGPDGVPVLPDEAFNAFLITTTIGGMLVSAIYGVVCIGGLMMFLRNGNKAGLVASVIGILTGLGGVFAQFVEGTAPVGDALWGRHLAILIAIAVGIWLAVNIAKRPRQVELAGQHTLHHE